MITWLQTSFGKHHKLLLGTLLAVTIVSFVFFGSWSGAQGGRGYHYLGVNLHSTRAMERYSDALSLSTGGRAELSTDQVKFQIFKTHLADIAQIPDPTAAQLRKFLPDILGVPESEIGKRVTDLVTLATRMFRTNQRDAEARVERFLSDSWRIQEALRLLAGTGYAQPFEAAMQWSLDNTQWTIESATLAGGAFSPTVTPDEEKLQAFFDRNKEQYKLPPRVTLAYATFPADKVELPAPSETELRAHAINNSAAFPDLDIAKVDDYLKTHRAAIAQHWIDEQTGIQAASKISTFIADELPIGGTPLNAEKVDHLLATHKITATTIPAFDKDNIPANLSVPAGILRQGLELSENIWRSDAYTLGKNAVVLFHKQTDPERYPDLAEVREKVTADYVRQETARLYAAHISEVGKKLRDGVTAGKKFDAAAKELNLQVKTYPAFKRMSMPSDFYGIEETFVRGLTETAAGAVTPVFRSGQDAIYVFVVKKEVPTPDMTAPELQQLQERMAFLSAYVTFQGSRQTGMPGVFAELYLRSNSQVK